MPDSVEALAVALQARDAADVRLLLGQHERDAGAAAAGPAGAADAVGVGVASSGGSKLITWVMSSTSSPRAATSVATSVRTLPESKRASARSRCACALSPWIATASTSWRRSFSTSRSAPAFVRTKTSARPVVVGQQLDERLHLVVGGDRDEAVVDLAGAQLLGQLAVEARREAGVAAGELADLAVERRREEHRLAVARAGGARSGRPAA